MAHSGRYFQEYIDDRAQEGSEDEEGQLDESDHSNSELDYDDDENVPEVEADELNNHGDFVVDDEDDVTDSDYEPGEEEEAEYEEEEPLEPLKPLEEEAPPTESVRKEVRYKTDTGKGIIKKVVTYYSMLAPPKADQVPEPTEIVAQVTPEVPEAEPKVEPVAPAAPVVIDLTSE